MDQEQEVKEVPDTSAESHRTTLQAMDALIGRMFVVLVCCLVPQGLMICPGWVQPLLVPAGIVFGFSKMAGVKLTDVDGHWFAMLLIALIGFDLYGRYPFMALMRHGIAVADSLKMILLGLLALPTMILIGLLLLRAFKPGLTRWGHFVPPGKGTSLVVALLFSYAAFAVFEGSLHSSFPKPRYVMMLSDRIHIPVIGDWLMLLISMALLGTMIGYWNRWALEATGHKVSET